MLLWLTGKEESGQKKEVNGGHVGRSRSLSDEAVALVDFIYLMLTRMPGDFYRRRLRVSAVGCRRAKAWLYARAVNRAFNSSFDHLTELLPELFKLCLFVC